VFELSSTRTALFLLRRQRQIQFRFRLLHFDVVHGLSSGAFGASPVNSTSTPCCAKMAAISRSRSGSDRRQLSLARISEQHISVLAGTLDDITSHSGHPGRAVLSGEVFPRSSSSENPHACPKNPRQHSFPSLDRNSRDALPPSPRSHRALSMIK